MRPAVAAQGAGYFCLPTPPLGTAVMEVPADAPAGTIRRAITIGTEPLLLAWGGERLVMIHTNTGGRIDAPRSWPVREVHLSAAAIDPSAVAALPPLRIIGSPTDVAVADSEIIVLTEFAAARELWTLRRAAADGWSRCEPPAGFDSSRPAQLLTTAGVVAVYQEAEPPTRGTLWRRERGAWMPSELPPTARAELHESAGQLVAVRREVHGSTTLFLISGASIIETASMPPPTGDRWIVPIATGLAMIDSTGPHDLPRLKYRLISPAGTILFDGWASTERALSRPAMTLMLLALLSVFSGALAFVFRPQEARQGAIALPPNSALAGPVRRSLAGIIDAGVAWAVAAWGRDVPLAALIEMPRDPGGDPVITLALALTVAVLTSCILEATLGRSIGKAITGCRVVSASGHRITIAQAFARNAVRFLCPPLGMAWMLAGPAAPPGLFGTAVIIDLEPDIDGRD